MNNDEFRAKLADLVRASGQELIDRADEIVGVSTLLYGFNIYIDFGFYEGRLEEVPKITVNHEYISRNVIKVLSEKEKKND